jgi:hypothetical protein
MKIKHFKSFEQALADFEVKCYLMPTEDNLEILALLKEFPEGGPVMGFDDGETQYQYPHPMLDRILH